MEKNERTEISPFTVQCWLAALKEARDTVRAYDTKAQAAMRAHGDAGRVTVIYEQAFRHAPLMAPAGTFKFEDITGPPWGEIDFPEDLARAHEVVPPQLEEIQPLKGENG